MPSKKKAPVKPPADNPPIQEGFYAEQFQPGEVIDLQGLMLTGVESEIHMLRVMMRRTLELSRGSQDIRQMTRVLASLGTASTRLAGLLKTQRILEDEQSGRVAESISQAIANVVEEMRISL